jgi:ElaB/YqjD/DUF883 family membrane-anchored ribosome-binding protein
METNFENLERAQGIIARARVLRDLKTLARDAEALIKVTAGDLSDNARAARDHLSRALESAKATCNEVQGKLAASARAASQRTDTLIRNNPYGCMGMAFGIGVLTGVLVIRK